jgi:transketolase
MNYTNTGNRETRAGFGAGLLEAGHGNHNVVALTADLNGSVKTDAFAAAFPERFFNAGIAEANMINIAAGLALCGKIKRQTLNL